MKVGKRDDDIRKKNFSTVAFQRTVLMFGGQDIYGAATVLTLIEIWNNFCLRKKPGAGSLRSALGRELVTYSINERVTSRSQLECYFLTDFFYS